MTWFIIYGKYILLSSNDKLKSKKAIFVGFHGERLTVIYSLTVNPRNFMVHTRPSMGIK